MSVQRYPNGMPRVAWICGACVADLSGGVDAGRCSTMHVGECGVCKRRRMVTEPGDYIWSGCRSGECD